MARSGEPEALVRRAIAALGGMERFVPRDASVIIKPNICVAYHTYEYAATTNPWVVGALVKLCLEAGARSVRVMDNPFGGTAEEAYEISGIAEQVKAAGGEMVVMSRLKFMPADIPQAASLKQSAVYDDALKADVLIDVPIAKNHSLARLTLGMKNLMGLIWDRQAIHVDIGQRLADLAGLFQPKLTVVDAVRVLMVNGGNHAGDNLALIRGSEWLMVDMADNPAWVRQAAQKVSDILQEVYRELWLLVDEKVTGLEGSLNYCGLWSPGKTMGFDCDSSCCISANQFEETFLPPWVETMRTVEHRIYHLDGSVALQHLQLLLSLPEIDAIQWVPGAGYERILQWIPLIQRIQKAGKAILVQADAADIPVLLGEVTARGLCIATSCASEKEAKNLLEGVG